MIKVNGKEIKFTKFPNGETNMDHKSFPHIGFDSPVIDFKYEEDGDLIKLLFVKEYIETINFIEIPVVLRMYFMPYSQMDRSEKGSPFTLKYISKFINSLNFRKVFIVEPHSDVSPALIDRSESIEMSLKMLPIVMEEIKFDEKTDYLVFPDATAQKRYGKTKGYKQIAGYKRRDFVTGEIGELQIVGDVEEGNSKALIVDDLCMGGYTFYLTALKLKELGFKKIYLLATHTVDTVFKGKIFSSNIIDKIFTTDSVLTKYEMDVSLKQREKMRVYKMEDLLND